ncbi:GbsR/MarR family transcriptional regulator [Streptomyces apocyni]|uniref:GbsR/MarR family transcriptional regulator n=1 Tax=Streptomyces apocyni TaxID=2654677 RepID=UPI0012EA1505|nr:helix-turn-helix domain-containing protein [Streptomyces apocyni]
MPGGRLTQQERQQIALGLADGLAYAEIARRLDRPTSTVTREVTRNGGPTAYRADLAQRATERRAQQRRQQSAPRGPQGERPRVDGRDPEAVREYEEAFTTVLMQSGLPKMTARVLACLFITDEDLTAADLVQRLQVSPASISKAITFLEGQGLVRRERGEGRRERYVVDGDIFYQATLASARANDQLVETARQGVGILGRDTTAGVRLENAARFLDFISETIHRAAEQARDVLHTKPAEREREG